MGSDQSYKKAFRRIFKFEDFYPSHSNDDDDDDDNDAVKQDNC